MRIYVITKGEYSDYGIVAVAIDKDKAEELRIAYSDKWGDAMIEEYETDDYYAEKGRFYIVNIGMRGAVKVYDTGVPDIDDRNKVCIAEDYRTHRKYYTVQVKATDEEHAKKIGCDLVAKYKAERAGL